MASVGIFKTGRLPPTTRWACITPGAALIKIFLTAFMPCAAIVCAGKMVSIAKVCGSKSKLKRRSVLKASLILNALASLTFRAPVASASKNSPALSKTNRSVLACGWTGRARYFTFDDSNIEHIWLFLKKCHEENWLAQDYRVMPWCPRCETSLSPARKRRFV